MKEVDEAASVPEPIVSPTRSGLVRVALVPHDNPDFRASDHSFSSTPAIWRGMQPSRINERTTLLRRQSLRLDYEAETGEVPTKMAGGTVLGIHNLAIVFPQFIVCSFSSIASLSV